MSAPETRLPLLYPSLQGSLVTEQDQVSAFGTPPKFRTVRLRTRSTGRRTPVGNIVEIRLNLKPDTACFVRADPSLDPTTALDDHNVELLHRQEPLDLDPFQRINEQVLCVPSAPNRRDPPAFCQCQRGRVLLVASTTPS